MHSDIESLLTRKDGLRLCVCEVGVLVLGVTPTIMLSSYVLLGTLMSLSQIIGVAITLVSVLIFGLAVRQEKS